jgi:HPt (histidine-containing phosphotransfer) domain-containing protein
MSADARNTVREEIIAAGMDDFISKPINPPDFFAVLERYGAQKQREQGPQKTDSVPAAPYGEDLFPERLPALSIADGIRRVGGNEGFYKIILADFFTTYRGEMEKLRQLVLEEKYTELELAAHTLKGAAATIGATEVADAADRLQRKAVNYQGENHKKDLKNQLTVLDKWMDTLWDSIDILQSWRRPQPEDSPSSMTPPVINPLSLSSSQGEQARALTLEIADQLLLDIPKARQSLESLGILVRNTSFIKDYETLSRLVGDFEISSARSLALKMARDLKKTEIYLETQEN